jgi:arginase
MNPTNAINTVPQGSIAIVGVPYDENSSFMRGAAQAPGHIRNALRSDSSNMCTEDGLDLTDHPLIQDVGDLDLNAAPHVLEAIESYYGRLLETGARALSLGGDHAITLPIIRAFAQKYRPLTILQLDAHPDLYDELGGNRYSHACPFARIMEEHPATRLIQVGIRTTTPHQQEQADRFHVEVIDMKAWTNSAAPEVSGPVYISLDLDVLDPAFAPGVSHHEPGGMTTRDVLGIIQGLKGCVVGADVVELNPVRDPSGVTAMTAAKFVKEIIGKMLGSI